MWVLQRAAFKPRKPRGIAPVFGLKLGGGADDLPHPFLECLGPQMRILDLGLVDGVDPEIQMDRLVARDLIVLPGNADHLVAVAERASLAR
jgi:hypothetical protein